MKSKTSFFNLTALKKDITRFAPIWVFYTIFLLLVLFAVSTGSDASTADTVFDAIRPMTWINLIYAGICAAFLFMDLFNGRLCNALHAFPVRRESWLSTHILAGFLFSFVPNLFVSLLASLMTWEFAYAPFIWLGASTLQFLFFFGTAVLSAMCAGNLLGMAAIYAIIHLITAFVSTVAVLLYQPLLHGVYFDTEAIYHFFPLYKLSGFRYVDFQVNYTDTGVYGKFLGVNQEDWLYLGICALFGVIALVLTFLVYRRRHLESAGDLISFRPLSPLFLTICTLGAGVLLYLFFDLMEMTSFLFLAIGIVIGYFTARMLLNRTVKVFTKKALLGLGIMVAVLAGTMCLTALDPLGVTRYVPEFEKVAEVRIIGADKGNYLYSYTSPLTSYRGNLSVGFPITDEAEIAEAQDFHRQLIRYRPDSNGGTLCDVKVVYTLTNGKTVARFYDVENDSALGIRAGKYFSDIRYIFEVKDEKILYDIFESVHIDGWFDENNVSVTLTDQQDIAGLLDAVKADCEAGLMAQNWAYHDKYEESYYIEFDAKADIFEYSDWDTNYFSLRIWPDCPQTYAYLKQMIDKYPQE